MRTWAGGRGTETYDLGNWQSTLEQFLAKTEDPGLTHAQVQVELARHFMDLKQWEKAWPFAEAAAKSGAQWAMLCAMECAVGKKDWETAENNAQQVSLRYPGGWATWFLFCKQTGHGDVAAARKYADEYLRPLSERPGLAEAGPVGYYYWLRDDTKTAMLWFRTAFARTPNPSTCFNLITLGDEIGDSRRGDPDSAFQVPPGRTPGMRHL